MLQGKTIVLGITGGIAAYKAAAVCSKLSQSGADVRVVMTESATKFIAPLTFQAISRNRVIVDTFDEEDPSVIAHIDLADRADAVVIAPATANFLAKTALGLGDDMLSTTLLATRAPILVAPAMNVHMYAHVTVQTHMEQLRARGVRFVEPGEGFLACGYTGKGRLAEPEHIVDELMRMFKMKSELSGKKVLVTAGATVERIDPVRYLTNDSSGKMGFAVAAAARDRGARVTVIAGRTSVEPPSGVDVIRVESAEEMLHAALSKFGDADIVVKAAAVADYRPVRTEQKKIKKSEQHLSLELERTTDILKELGNRKTHQVLVGFAAETHELERQAMAKIASKRCDLVVANDVTIPGAGFSADTNEVSIFDTNGLVEKLPLQSKRDAAERIVTLAAGLLAERSGGKQGR
ncbi:bifunctional phosphopantothenoylcysteine decarboxylase/phosphopantothenate--cysteine ligase CoaBC [Paenibacillus alkalitolerans]|uniref:bifunctional phosphopantothenoylcysteine decarboxylase/phosphopantothenate--cysteine ligase CoaBC n=1 Tax=Paenibacillus alkalitolerans TaxID=2799335 RepID=UPI0018F54E95|nr:bifunctional phosphopantothenoylcysteine decarboxylase/phosphopantothenate--cysteine ligase CoaBC [Paenibacillus alkalitolerans]